MDIIQIKHEDSSAQKSNLKIMNTNKITSIDDLKDYISKFLKDDNLKDDEILVDSELRREIRHFKTLYPTLWTFTYGLGKEHTLQLSKTKITIDYSRLTPKCKKMFIKYSGIKINPDDKNINVYEHVKLDTCMELLFEALLYTGGEKNFISKHYELKKLIVQDLKKLEDAYQKWQSTVIDKKPLTRVPTPIKSSSSKKKAKDLYQEENHGQHFISVDLKSANFQTIQLNGLCTEKSWTEYMSKFIQVPYFAKSKILRMETLSDASLYPQKQQTFWYNITIDILNSILENKVFDQSDFACINSDEIVFHSTENTIKSDYEAVVTLIKNTFSIYDITVTPFRLYKIAKNKPFFVKICQITGKVDYKCVNEAQLPLAIELWKTTGSDRSRIF